ncbi:hypothetical protein GCWU000324_00633 [Kingella oralis ATCC 51147]|uniref:Uncharacterized protein n=1 Tax=Kingella oralis ATCC 51147 TaxID=629741 RepID=C4GES4_9NEIS|nr:hypothetical protein GCWU000324_00633 [Kingella oralis ATCC 51147]
MGDAHRNRIALFPPLPSPSRTFFLFDTNSYLIPLLTHLYILFRSFYNPRF